MNRRNLLDSLETRATCWPQWLCIKKHSPFNGSENFDNSSLSC